MATLKPPPIGSTAAADLTENLDLRTSFFSSRLITYIGNKRRLLPFLYRGFLGVRKRLGGRRWAVLDGFAGSGAVARLLKAFSGELHVNDLEGYSQTLNRAYLANASEVERPALEDHIRRLNARRSEASPDGPGFIEKHYAPRDDRRVRPGERVFYTNANARIIDNLRRLIDEVPEAYRHFCLASLLVESSVHTNTSGIFKGFHKCGGVGHFGGKGENALTRILGEIELEMPIFSSFECPVTVHRRDIGDLARDPALPDLDLAYYDPPYNQHPYGSNYFMLNLINDGKPRPIQNGVSGITKDWNRSAYNKSGAAEKALDALLGDTRAKFIALSYNDEGIIPTDRLKKVLDRHGNWELLEQDYNTYRGSRNLRGRSLKVKERLWIVEKRRA